MMKKRIYKTTLSKWSFKRISIVFLILFSNALFSQSYEWTRNFGGTGLDFGNDIIVDPAGNIYTVGSFEGTVDFDPGVGVLNHSSAGAEDIFISKLNDSGDLLWVKTIGGISDDQGFSIDLDDDGNVYTTGNFVGTVDFDPGIGVVNLTSAGSRDVFVSKLDPSGEFLWAKNMGGTGSDVGSSLKIAASGDVLISGHYNGTADFDPGVGVMNLIAVGFTDVFVSKLNSSGDFIWAKSIGGTNVEFLRSITSDSFGDIYLTGKYQGTADFDPGIGVENLTAVGGSDIFILKLTSLGNLDWVKSIGNASHADVGVSIAVDESGHVLATGTFSGTVDFDPGAGVSNLISYGSYDVFVLKLDESGNYIWAKNIGGPSIDESRDLVLDNLGNIYHTGYFLGTVDFDPGIGVENISAIDNSDIYLTKLDPSGNFVWVVGIGGTGYDYGTALFVDDSKNVFTIGSFHETVDFNHEAGVDDRVSNGLDDVFIQKMSQCLASTGTDVQSACESYTWIDGETYTEDEFAATHTLTNEAGCDSVVTLNLTILSASAGTDVQSACESYTWIDGETYTEDEFAATHTLTNESGCDSVVTLNLTILSASTATDVQSACESYTWIDGETYTEDEFAATHTLTNESGCDSVVTLNLTILSASTGTDVQSACESYSWIDGETYTEDEFAATHILTNEAGCDSVVTLNLTILSASAGTDVQSACESYSWIDGETYTEDEFAATHTLTSEAGCDSVVTLNLTILSASTGTDVQSACESYTWIDGETYTEDEFTATHTLTNEAGCDSAVTLNLTILSASTGADVQSACESYTWIDGETYTEDEFAATHTLTNEAGCDSVVTLNLTILSASAGTDVQSACESYTWIDGETYTEDEFAATHTLTNEAGCDSVVTLNLTILSASTGTDVQSACESYTWIDGETYTEDEFAATHTLTNEAGCDSVVTLNLTILSASTGTDVQSACESYSWIDGETYTEDEFAATHILTNEAGCDSVVTLNLTILSASAGTDVQSACESYTWINGETYTEDEFAATHILTNEAGCDSVVTLNLTILSASAGTDVQSACESYTWIDGETYTEDEFAATHTLTNEAGCDSVVTLNLTILSASTGTDVQSACESYTWIDGETYTEDEFAATHTLTNEAGCDSVVTLELTILELNTVVTNDDPILNAIETDAEFQWLNCLNDFEPILGATSMSFIPDDNGEYAVEISKDGCVDTSDCFVITTMGFNDLSRLPVLNVYPNPTHGDLTIDFDGLRVDRISVYNVNGELVYNKLTVDSINSYKFNFDVPSGMYLIEVHTNDSVLRDLVIKR